MARDAYLYILASRKHGTLYVGAASDLVKRVWDHKQGVGGAFTRRYGVTRLVYLEEHASIQDAVARERQIKKSKRAWKIQLVEETNPNWRDLYDDICR